MKVGERGGGREKVAKEERRKGDAINNAPFIYEKFPLGYIWLNTF